MKKNDEKQKMQINYYLKLILPVHLHNNNNNKKSEWKKIYNKKQQSHNANIDVVMSIK